MKRNSPHDVFKFVQIPTNTADPIPCWLWEGARGGRDGRAVFSLNGKRVQANRLVWELVNGRQLDANEVLMHTCDTPHCCSPHHNKPNTQQANMEDMVIKQRVGMAHDRVQEIMRWIDKNAPPTWIAEKFGISRQLVSDIKARRRYAVVPWPKEDNNG